MRIEHAEAMGNVGKGGIETRVVRLLRVRRLAGSGVDAFRLHRLVCRALASDLSHLSADLLPQELIERLGPEPKVYRRNTEKALPSARLWKRHPATRRLA